MGAAWPFSLLDATAGGRAPAPSMHQSMYGKAQGAHVHRGTRCVVRCISACTAWGSTSEGAAVQQTRGASVPQALSALAVSSPARMHAGLV